MKKMILLVWVLMVPCSVVLGGSAADAGNKNCPVSGAPATGQEWVEHEGQRYKLCCAACASEFHKDPHKYLAKMAPKDTCLNVDDVCSMDEESGSSENEKTDQRG